MTVERIVPAAPARGTRPRNRRALILAAATDLFYRRGYDQLGMGDIAESVAIGPSALYRHFAGKQDLLREVITAGLAPVHDLLDHLDFTDRATATSQVARIALDHRQLGVLWQREARYLRPQDLRDLRVELRDIGRQLASRVQDAHPHRSRSATDLLAWSMVATVMSTSFHRLDLPRPEYDELLTELVGSVLDTELPDDFPPPPETTRRRALVPQSRREALLAEAVGMFAREGYTGVGIEDIGAAVGIAGPSVYNHFPSKRDLLTTALGRGTAVLFMDLAASCGTASDATDGLRRLVRSYVRFTLEHHDLVGLLITELEHLPEDRRHAARQTQHDYVSEWVHLLRTVHPRLDPTAARIRVHAALTIANDAARTSHLRRNPAVPAALETICTRILRLPPD